MKTYKGSTGGGKTAAEDRQLQRRTIHELDRSTTGRWAVTQAISSIHGAYQKRIHEKKQERALGYRNKIR